MAKIEQAVILAGGLGTRLRPITEKIPKPMVPVAGHPFLEWQLADLKRQGFTRVLLLVAYLGEQVREFFGDGRSRGLEIEYAFEKEPLGTGGALKNAEGQLDEKFLLFNGDSFLRAPLTEMINAFSGDALISSYDKLDQVPVIANLKLATQSVGARTQVLDYQKDAGRENGFTHIDSGIYVLRREILVSRKSGTRFALAELWPPLIFASRVHAFAVAERFYDIGTPERLQEFEEKVHDYFPHSLSY